MQSCDTEQSIPKYTSIRRNKSDSNNYRQIVITSLMGKLFDIIILEEQHHGLITDELQFGFKKNALLCYNNNNNNNDNNTYSIYIAQNIN